ncbi:MAG: hypothetical protein ACTHU0_24960 [Kofleriaceae bacterium]
MPIDIASDHDERAVSAHESGPLAQTEARDQSHAVATNLAYALGGSDGDIDDATSHREEMP